MMGMAIIIVIYLFGGQAKVQGATGYDCKSESQLKEAISYSNQHVDTWVNIQLQGSFSITKAYEIKGKVRMLPMETCFIRRKGFKDHLFQVSGRLQTGSSGSITAVSIDGGSRQGEYGEALIEVLDGGTLEMYDGSRVQYNYNRKNDDSVLPRAGGVLVQSGGTFTMNGGTIRYCWSKNAKVLDAGKNSAAGGGVYVGSESTKKYGTFILKDGIIENCASQHGGGVYSLGLFEMSGGQIIKNHASLKKYESDGAVASFTECSDSTGGGIKVQAYTDATSPKTYGKTIISGGSIEKNDAYNGGGIRVTNGADVQIQNGLIVENSAANRGGGIDIGNGFYEDRTTTKVTITKGVIMGCHADGNGGGISLDDGTCKVSDLQVTINEANGSGNGLYLEENGKFYMEGQACFQEHDHIYLRIGAFIRISGKLTSQGSVATIRVADSQYRLGRKVATVTYTGTGADGLYDAPKSSEGAKFMLYQNDNGYDCFRPGDGLASKRLQEEKEISLGKKDIFISKAYQISYYKNRTKEVQKMPEDGTKYWYEDSILSEQVPETENAKFLHWYTRTSTTKEGESYFPNSSFTANKNLNLYAIWDEPLKIVISSDAFFYENEVVGEKELLSFIQSLEDKEDGTIKNPDVLLERVKVLKISYEASSDGYRPKEQIFENGMKQEVMDTYFKHLKEKESVRTNVIFTAEDLSGNKTEQEAEVFIKYNEPPTIEAKGLSYYDYEIKDQWEKVKEEIVTQPVSSDKEDKELGRPNPKITIKKPESLRQNDFQIPALYQITYEAEDSLGKTVQITVPIFVASSNPYAQATNQYIRFIRQAYLTTLGNDSPWKQNMEQLKLLQKSLATDVSKAKKTVVVTIER